MILIKPWEEAAPEAYSIRSLVFIEEQGVPQEIEIDEWDPLAQHALAYEDGYCIATGRLVKLQDGSAQIGRMAVLAQFRKQGIGSKVLTTLIEYGKSLGAFKFILHSQLTAIPFYEKQGFIANGPIYDEAGIAHRNMILLISATD